MEDTLLATFHFGAGSMGQTPSHVLTMTNARGRLGTYVLPFLAHWENTTSNPTLSNKATKRMV